MQQMQQMQIAAPRPSRYGQAGGMVEDDAADTVESGRRCSDQPTKDEIKTPNRFRLSHVGNKKKDKL